jgi:hypothetical protein
MRGSVFKMTMGLMMSLVLINCSTRDASETIRNVTEEPELQGTFIEPNCGPRGFWEQLNDALMELLAGDAIHSQVELNFQANQFTQTTRYYLSGDDGACEDEMGRLITEGTFEVNTEDLEGTDARSIRIELETARVEVVSERAAEILNEIGFCGRSDYEAGESFDITEGTEDNCPLVGEVPRTYFGSYILTDNRLYISQLQVTDMATESADRREASQDDAYLERR